MASSHQLFPWQKYVDGVLVNDADPKLKQMQKPAPYATQTYTVMYEQYSFKRFSTLEEAVALAKLWNNDVETALRNRSVFMNTTFVPNRKFDVSIGWDLILK